MKRCAVLFAICVSSACIDLTTYEDCRTAEDDWGDKTKSLGESCAAGSYGACPDTYDDCIEGVCAYGPEGRGSICMASCESESDCSLGTFCKEGVCQPAASCSSFCDGFCCCDYFTDPEDPTQCQQGSCFCG